MHLLFILVCLVQRAPRGAAAERQIMGRQAGPGSGKGA